MANWRSLEFACHADIPFIIQTDIANSVSLVTHARQLLIIGLPVHITTTLIHHAQRKTLTFMGKITTSGLLCAHQIYRLLVVISRTQFFGYSVMWTTKHDAVTGIDDNWCVYATLVIVKRFNRSVNQ